MHRVDFAHLLAERYRRRLDGEADQYIGVIVDSTTHLLKLINSLLDFFACGFAGNHSSLIRTSCNAVLEDALLNVRTLIEESQGIITSDQLPGVIGDPLQR